MDGPSLDFPDGPKVELDRAVHDLVDRADKVLHTQGRLRSLLNASASVSEEIDLPRLLERIVMVALDLVDAKYGALGVIGVRGELEELIYHGIPDSVAEQLEHLPDGLGLLGAVITTSQPIRLEDVRKDPRSLGTPLHHPDLHSFLGVPVRVGDEIFGNLYLAERRGGPFTEEDEELVLALASTAGNAIRNARLYREAQLREMWMTATARVIQSLLDAHPDDAFEVLLDGMASVPGASPRMTIVTRGETPGHVRIAAARGPECDGLEGRELPADSTEAALVLESGESRMRPGGFIREAGADALELRDGEHSGASLFLPLCCGSAGAAAVITAHRRPGEGAFGEVEFDIAQDLAHRVTLALELVRARDAEQRGMILEDRARIARDLHDHVIQLLFSAGLDLQNLRARPHPDEETHLLDGAIQRLDDAIARTRTVVFALSPQPTRSPTAARHALLDLAAEASKLLPRPVDVKFDGPIDILVTDHLLDDVSAVVRELLTNVVKHAHAETVSLSAEVTDTDVVVTVSDDGIGLDDHRLSGGVRNLRERARARGGSLDLESAGHGTRARWSVPLTEFQGDGR